MHDAHSEPVAASRQPYLRNEGRADGSSEDDNVSNAGRLERATTAARTDILNSVTQCLLIAAFTFASVSPGVGCSRLQ